MIDLSNNNGTGHDYARAKASGHTRIYFKASESDDFADKVIAGEGKRAHGAGMRVGAYHFAHGDHPPAAEFANFMHKVSELHFPLQLRPALDLEHGSPGRELWRWTLEWSMLCHKELGVAPLFYGSGWFLERLQFKAPPGGLWLASYGRDDGKEYPYKVPKPWRLADAHQFTAAARVPGIRGHCDVSHVYRASAVDWPGR